MIPVQTLPVLSNRALDRSDRLEAQGRVDEARVEADLAAALNRTSARRPAPARQPAAGARPGRATRAARSTRALGLAPEDAQTWLTLAGYQRWCWRTWPGRRSATRARALSGHDNVFTGSDEDVILASDACPAA